MVKGEEASNAKEGALMAFELLCETTSELFLQTYKGGHDHFVKDEEPSRLLKMSISISLCTLASGACGRRNMRLRRVPHAGAVRIGRRRSGGALWSDARPIPAGRHRRHMQRRRVG